MNIQVAVVGAGQVDAAPAQAPASQVAVIGVGHVPRLHAAPMGLPSGTDGSATPLRLRQHLPGRALPLALAAKGVHRDRAPVRSGGLFVESAFQFITEAVGLLALCRVRRTFTPGEKAGQRLIVVLFILGELIEEIPQRRTGPACVTPVLADAYLLVPQLVPQGRSFPWSQSLHADHHSLLLAQALALHVVTKALPVLLLVLLDMLEGLPGLRTYGVKDR